jgi:hypothetical protein
MTIKPLLNSNTAADISPTQHRSEQKERYARRAELCEDLLSASAGVNGEMR